MINWLSIGSWSIASIALALIALGAVITIIYGIVKGMLWCLGLSSRLLSWAWARMTGKPVSSHGTAHFGNAAEVQASGLLNDDGMPLAQWQGQTLREPVNGHVALVAPPRSHKSWG
jgi:type IV secretory pathway TraG/TraD family ATPase VirD4